MTTAAPEAPDQTRDDHIREAGETFLRLNTALHENGLTFTDLLLGMDMRDFDRIGYAASDMRDLQPIERTATVRRSRVFWQREPLVSRAVSMWTEFAFGQPWSIQAQVPAFQALIDEVLAAAHNRRVFGRQGQQRASNSLLVDGERAFVFFVGQGRINVRNLDPLEVTEILSNPDDRDEPWYYVRNWTAADNKRRVAVYRDWNFIDDAGNPRSDAHPLLTREHLALSGSAADADLQPRENEWVTLVEVNTIGQRGYPLFTSGLDWVREHREFLKGRAAITAARARFAMKATVRGSQTVVDQLKSTLEGPSTRPEDGTVPVRGSAWVQNQSTDLEMMSSPSDGASARQDERSLRLMALISAGIPEHLIGDVSTGNLATAAALEEPLRNMFASYQGVWMDFYEELCEHVAAWRGYSGDMTIDIDAPSIFGRDLTQLAQVVSSLVTSFPAVRRSPEVLSLILTELGLNNVDEIIELLEPYLDEEPEQPAGFGGRREREEEDAVREAIRALREGRGA